MKELLIWGTKAVDKNDLEKFKLIYEGTMESKFSVRNELLQPAIKKQFICTATRELSA